MALTAYLIPSFVQMLSALSGWLDKASRQFPDDAGEALLGARLAPDMFPLSTQVRFACVQPLEAVARLTRQPFAPLIAELLDEGRMGGEHPGTLAEAKARIAQTLAMLGEVAPDALDLAQETPLDHALPNGMTFDFTALIYARDWALPQFNFHLMMAYAILRSQGVALGKIDVIPHLLGYLRPAA